MWYVYWGILIGWKKKWNPDICKKMGRTGNVKWNKQTQHNTILYTEHKVKIIYMCILAYMYLDHEARMVVMRLWEEILMWGCRESNGCMWPERRMGCLPV